MTDEHEVLSALIDREPVDPDVLAHLLEDPSNRALLVEFVRLRADLNDGSESGVADSTGMAHLPSPGQPPATAALRLRSWLRMAAMVLLLALGAGGGALLQYQWSRERPPQPDRIVRLEPVESR
jgi:hypothetical protein